MVFDRLDGSSGIVGSVDVRHLYAHNAAVHELSDRLEGVDVRSGDGCYACGFGGHDHKFDALDPD